MKIVLTYNLKKKDESKPADYFSECDSEETINAIIAALKKRGHTVEAIDVGYPTLVSYFRKNRVDMVFNIAEGVKGKFRESEVPAILDYLNIPYTVFVKYLGVPHIGLSAVENIHLAITFVTGLV